MDSLVAVGGSMAGGEVAKLMGAGSNGATGPDVQAGVKKMNKILTQGLNNALNYTQNYTNQGIGAQNTGLTNATSAINQGLTGATTAVNTALNQGLQQYQAAQAPYATAGYSALDAYTDSLGLNRPTVGSAAIAQSQQQLNNLMNDPTYESLLSSGQSYGAGNPFANPGSAPVFNQTAPHLSDYLNQITTGQENDWIKQNIKQGPHGGYSLTDPLTGNTERLGNNHYRPDMLFNTNPISYGVGNKTYTAVNPNIALLNQAQQTAQQNLANSLYQPALQQFNAAQANYNTNLNNYNAYNTAYNNFQNTLNQINPQAIQTALAYKQGLFG